MTEGGLVTSLLHELRIEGPTRGDGIAHEECWLRRHAFGVGRLIRVWRHSLSAVRATVHGQATPGKDGAMTHGLLPAQITPRPRRKPCQTGGVAAKWNGVKSPQ